MPLRIFAFTNPSPLISLSGMTQCEDVPFLSSELHNFPVEGEGSERDKPRLGVDNDVLLDVLDRGARDELSHHIVFSILADENNRSVAHKRIGGDRLELGVPLEGTAVSPFFALCANPNPTVGQWVSQWAHRGDKQNIKSPAPKVGLILPFKLFSMRMVCC